MEEQEFVVRCKESGSFDTLVEKFQGCKEAHAKLHGAVLGFARAEEPWIVLDDCLRMSYEKMMDTLEQIEERK